MTRSVLVLLLGIAIAIGAGVRSALAAYAAQARAAAARALDENTRAIPGWPANTLLRAIVLAQGDLSFPRPEYDEARRQHERTSWLGPVTIAATMECHDRLAAAQLNAHDADQLARLRAEFLRAHPTSGLVLADGYRLWLDDALRRHGLA